MGEDQADIAVVGGSAADLAAAVFAAEALREDNQDRRVVILDGAARLGAKILVAGGGRCNVTHHHIQPDDYHAPRPVVRNILRHFDVAAAVAWFARLGVELKREPTGKLFPVTDQARTVLDALLNRCSELGVEILTGHRVTAAARDAGMLVVQTPHGDFHAHRLILATGGRSLPRTGSDGGGYALARALGHTVTPTHPALAPLVLDDTFFHATLSGLAQDVELSTFDRGRVVDRRSGSLLWTHFGVSGPVVMDASRFWIIAAAEGRSPELRCAVLASSFEATEAWLIDVAMREPRRGIAAVVADRVPRRFAEALVAHLDLGGPIGQLQREARRRLVHGLTALRLPVVRDRGWNYAEVTAGGVPLAEVDHRTMQSRVAPGLHLAGEILDCDGRIGGFNFQWAWATGYLAGRAAASAVLAPA